MAKNFDHLGRILTTLGAVTVTILVAIYALVNDNYGLMAIMLAIAPMAALVNSPAVWLLTIVGLSQTNFIVPGLPAGLQLIHYLMAGFCVVIVAQNIITKQPRAKMTAPLAFVWLIIGWMMFIISQRGIGLMSVGEKSAGGSTYVRIFVGACYLFCSRYVMLDARQWRRAILLMFAGSLIPAIAEMLYTFSGGSVSFQYRFIEPYIFGLVDAMDAMASGARAVRFTTLAPIAQNLLFATVVFFTYRNKFRIVTYVLIIICLGIAGLTGFRSLLVELILIACIYRLLIAPRRQRGHILFIISLALLAAFLLLLPLARYFPLPLQRALSFVPFVEVDAGAAFEARASTAWRLDLWRYCLNQIPDYLWVGRGIAVNLSDAMSYTSRFDEVLGPWDLHLYHNGPLGLLIDTGLIGLLLVMFFLLFATRAVMTTRFEPADPFVYRFYTFLRAKIIASIFMFIFIAGSINVLPTTFLYLSIFYALQVTGSGTKHKVVVRDFSIVDPAFGGTSSSRPRSR